MAEGFHSVEGISFGPKRPPPIRPDRASNEVMVVADNEALITPGSEIR
jgi:hypothetical protein